MRRDSAVWSEWVMGVEHSMQLCIGTIGDADYICLLRVLLEYVLTVVVAAWTGLHAKERL
jgi:hypothetical protein